jgi:S-adenosylmethionine:tRNA ribosyltransferase-isomerase
MQLSDFHFDLPPELIAQTPAEPRDSARLLVYNRLTGEIIHSHVRNIGDFLPKPSLLVANNSKVRKARFFGTTDSGKKVELLVLDFISGTTYRCIVGGRHITPKTSVLLYENPERDALIPLTATVLSENPHESMTTFEVEFSTTSEKSLESLFEEYGEMPLPPYITSRESESSRYQTVFAKELGSAAAPTAGLHFTPELITTLTSQGIAWAEVTLHVGMGTFLPLRKNTITENHLHQEHTIISPATAAQIHTHQAEASNVVAIGTTSTRTLEAHSQSGILQEGSLDTELFIYPGYRFQTVNSLLTNFHLPDSSLLLLLAAFLGNHPDNTALLCTPEEMTTRLHFIYNEAISQRYRFFSFGDAMLIL